MNVTEVEATLIGSILNNPSQLDDFELDARDFESRECREIYLICRDMREANEFIDPVTVSNRFPDIGYLSRLVMSAGYGKAVDYAKVVHNQARVRDLLVAWQEAGEVLRDAGRELSYRADTATDILSSAIKHDAAGGVTLSGVECMREWYQELQRLAEVGDEITGIKSPFPLLDARTKGWHGGEMIVVAARPGMGKTNLAINFAWEAVKQGKQVLYFSLEMSRTELMHRIASQAKSINYSRIQSGALDEVGGQITTFVADYREMSLHINDRAGHTMGSIKTESRKVMRKHGLDMILIDHIGLLNSKHDNQYNKMTEISRQVKVLAKELNVPVFALTQLNRSVEQRQDPIPKMSDLRDSGAIEQDADIVMFPHREIKEDGSSDLGQLRIAKLRHGQIGNIPLLVDFARCRFMPDTSGRNLDAKPEPKKKMVVDL